MANPDGVDFANPEYGNFTVVVSFILWTPGTGGQPWGLVPGGLPLTTSVMIGGAVALVFAWYVRLRKPAV